MFMRVSARLHASAAPAAPAPMIRTSTGSSDTWAFSGLHDAPLDVQHREVGTGPAAQGTVVGLHAQKARRPRRTGGDGLAEIRPGELPQAAQRPVEGQAASGQGAVSQPHGLALRGLRHGLRQLHAVGDQHQAIVESSRRHPDHGGVDVVSVADEIAAERVAREHRARHPRLAVVHRPHGVEEVGDVGEPARDPLADLGRARAGVSERRHGAALAELREQALAPGELRREGHHAQQPAGAIEDLDVAGGVEGAQVLRRQRAGRLGADPRALEVQAETARTSRGQGVDRAREPLHSPGELVGRPRHGRGEEGGGTALQHGPGGVGQDAREPLGRSGEQRPVEMEVHEAGCHEPPFQGHASPVRPGRLLGGEPALDAPALDEEGRALGLVALRVDDERTHQRRLLQLEPQRQRPAAAIRPARKR
jgi:hypothetical protein